jgi:predicted PhzF superfamily epimerase YddE/YHI9
MVWEGTIFMRADVFISQTESGGVEISVVKHGMSSGAARKYDTSPKAKEVLLAFGIDAVTVERQLQILLTTPPNVLVRLPTVEIADDILGSVGFKAAAFMGAA